jgi:hypothetical protein
LSAADWIDPGSPSIATNDTVSAVDLLGAAAQRFYRVRLRP